MYTHIFIYNVCDMLCVTQELEKLASRKLKISAKETMKIAEKLYTRGYESYKRSYQQLSCSFSSSRSLSVG